MPDIDIVQPQKKTGGDFSMGKKVEFVYSKSDALLEYKSTYWNNDYTETYHMVRVAPDVFEVTMASKSNGIPTEKKMQENYFIARNYAFKDFCEKKRLIETVTVKKVDRDNELGSNGDIEISKEEYIISDLKKIKEIFNSKGTVNHENQQELFANTDRNFDRVFDIIVAIQQNGEKFMPREGFTTASPYIVPNEIASDNTKITQSDKIMPLNEFVEWFINKN